jgi:hypothetical protein
MNPAPIILTEELYQELLRVLKLREQGCTCTPRRLRGGPAVYAEDVLCPLHRPMMATGGPFPRYPGYDEVLP